MKHYLISLFAGFVYSLSYPNIFLEVPLSPVCAPIGLAILFYKLTMKDLKKDLLLLFSFTISIGIFGFYWIPNTLHSFGDIPLPIGIVLFSFFIPLLTPHAWISYFALRFIKSKKLSHPFIISIIATAFILTLIEAITPTQFPVHVGQSWINSPHFLGLAPIAGLPVYSFFNYYFALSLSRKNYPHLLLSLVILLLFFTSSFFTLQEKALSTKGNTRLEVRFVQANIGNFMKIQSELGEFPSMQEVYSRYSTQSTRDLNKEIDLVIWPETAFPEEFNSTNLKIDPQMFSPYLKNIILQTNSDLFLGAYDVGQLEKSKNSFQTIYNSGILISKDRNYKDVYHKQSLIPFGETLPFGSFNKYLQKVVTGVSFFSQGALKTIFETKKNLKFIAPICYEILQPALVRDLLNYEKSPTDFIVNLTNDSWYGRTAEPYQHLFLAKWRAVEFQKPLLRSTNSGITSVIDIDARESQRLLLGEIDKLDLSLNMPKRYTTIYQKLGLFSFIFLCIFFNFIAFIILKLFTRPKELE